MPTCSISQKVFNLTNEKLRSYINIGNYVKYCKMIKLCNILALAKFKLNIKFKHSLMYGFNKDLYI